MANFDVLNKDGQKVSTVELSDAVFGITPNEKAVHIAVMPVRVLSVLLSGLTAALPWAPSPATTATASTRRSSVWPF